MPILTDDVTAIEPRYHWLPAAGIAVGASVILGGLTSLAQGILPEALVSFANSASGWTILTALIIWFLRTGTIVSAALGAASFVSLVMGYTLVSDIRGIYYSPVLFGVIGLVVGPFVGGAAAWLHRHGWRAAAGTALLSGIGVGEMIYGLTHIADTTEPFYWVLIGVLSLALLFWTIVRRVNRPLVIVCSVLLTAGIAGLFNYAYVHLAGSI